MRLRSMERWHASEFSPSTHQNTTSSSGKWQHAWLVWIFLGFGLLVVDTWNSVALVRSIAGALQSRPVEVGDTFVAVLAAMAMTASQFWFFAHISGESASVMGSRRAFWITVLLVVPGIFLNVFANFFVFVGGQPSPTLIVDLEQALATASDRSVGRMLLIFAGMIAVIVSFFPEFLVERGWREFEYKARRNGATE